MTQTRLIYDREMQEARRYWTSRLSSISFDPVIPTDHPRPSGGGRPPQALTFDLDAGLRASLRQLTSGNSSLLFAVLILALRLCGERYGGSRQPTIFCPTMGEGGVDLVPIAEDLSPEMTVRDSLLATRALLSTAYRHQRYGLSHLRRQLPEDSRSDRLPLVAAMAGLHKETSVLEGDIVLVFDSREASCAVTIRYDPGIYDEGSMRGLFETFTFLLRQALDDLRRPIGALQSAEGVGASRAAFAPPETVGGDEVRIHRLIETIACDAPERPAVVHPQGVTSFGALLDEAERLRGLLGGLKLDPDSPVAILVGDGLDAIVSMLAVAKAGRAFVLVRPAFLQRPLDEALGELGCVCLICGPGQLEGSQASLAPAHRIVLTRSAADGAEAPRLDVEIIPATDPAKPPARAFEIAPGTACLLIDGRSEPGTVTTVSHAELVRVFSWLNAIGGIGPGDRSLLLPGLGACEQLYVTLGLLMSGGTVELSAAFGLDQAEAIAGEIADPAITLWVLTLPLMQNLLKALPASRGDKATGPRRILLAGEAQSAPFAAKLAGRFGSAEVTGLWADSALGLWSLYFPYAEHDPDGDPVAHEIPGFDHSVLSADGIAVPRGVAGELNVRRLAAGNPDWRATGLWARSLGKGQYRWLRGPDHLVMKDDCRVELIRLETLLGSLDAIGTAQLVASEDCGRGSRVFAFVTAADDALQSDGVLGRLEESGKADLLPDHLIVIDSLPLGPGGEIDVAALLADHIGLASWPRLDALSEEIKARLKPIWLRTLQQEEVGDDDSFFGSGGNSLKATLLITRIKEEFGVEPAIQDFFRRPTIRAIVELIRAGQEAAAGHAVHDLKPVPRDGGRVLRSEMERPARTA